MSTLQIKDLLDINPHFVRSVQLERDFSEPRALEGYIVTPELVSHLRRLSPAFQRQSQQRSWRITGDFGSGKSSFALVLANLLSRSAADLPKSVRGLREELGLVRSAAKLLPVLVTGAREALSSALLQALYTAINQSIDGRRRLRSKSYIEELLAAKSCSDKEAVEAIKLTSLELVESGLFGGLLIILDELGKFLEFAALHPERQDVYFLQQLGEAADRSGDAPITVVGLLHQGFTAYADRLSDSAQREWDKVAERYQELVFTQPLSQIALLLAAALRFKDSEQLRGWKTGSRQDMGTAVDLGLFGPSAGKTSLVQLAPELYPLHPTVLPILARFFRRFGQNERSLFSFLLSSESYALQEFAAQEASMVAIYRLSDFYDYAAHNFAHRLSSQSFRSHWNHIDAVIRSAANESEEDLRLLKTIGILNVIESRELSPTEEVLELALGWPDNLKRSLKNLCKRNILFFRGKGGYALWPHASVNLEQAFLNASEVVTDVAPLAEVVQTRLDTRPVLARRHYIQTGNLRHFAVRFLSASEFAHEVSQLEVKHPADGLLVVVLCETMAERQEAERIALCLSRHPQILVVVSSALESLRGFALELERWLHVEHQTLELKDDRFAAEEVSRQIATVSQSLESRIDDYVGFRNAEAAAGISWFHRGGAVRVLNEGLPIQTFLSDLFDDIFNLAPKIENELINRHSISAAAAAARQKLFKYILESGESPGLGLPEDKAPPEKSMYLSVLQASGIHRFDGKKWKITFPPEGNRTDPCRVRPALNAIISALEKTPDAKINVNDIWELLRRRPYGVRDGLIPVLLLTALIEHEAEIAVYEDGMFRPAIEEYLMMRLVKVPKTFEFQLCRIAGIRKEVVSQLAAVVGADKAGEAQLLSIIRPLYVFITGLPEYVRNTDNLPPKTLALRKAIVEGKDPAILVFSAIPKALDFDPSDKRRFDPIALATELSHALTNLRRSFPELQTRMTCVILEAFGVTNESFGAWRLAVAERAETVLLGVTDPDLRAFTQKLTDKFSAEAQWLESLGSLITRCPPSRWRDRDEETFRQGVTILAGQFRRVLATCFERDGAVPAAAIRVTLTRRSGDERERVLQLTPDQERAAVQLSQTLRLSLGPDREASLTALSQLIWELIE